MASGKRASMREGPLAALFRRTEEEGARPDEGREGEEPGQGATEGGAQRPPEPATAAAREREGAVEAPAPQEPPEPAEPERPAVPTPRERLRHAFASDIPENVLEADEARGAPAVSEATEPPDAYARAGGDLYGQPASVGAPVIRVVGVGGAGVNAVNRMVEAQIEGVEFIGVNTDLQSLQQCAAHVTLHIGAGVTRGLGSGSDPDLGRQAAMEEYDKIKALLKGADMVFVTAGAGGGTGTGAAPILARIAREIGALTVGIITKPFGFEGSRRREQADEGVRALGEEVDTLIVVPNNRLLSVLDKNTSMVEAFEVADDVLRQGVQGISDLVTLPGLINLDFADVRTIMSEAGDALLGIGMATGDRRAIEAAQQAVASPLLETSMDGARSILLSITGGRDLSLWEVNEAAKAVAEAAHPEANIIFGAMVDEKLDDAVWVTVVATGYGARRPSPREEPRGEPRVSRGPARQRPPEPEPARAAAETPRPDREPRERERERPRERERRSLDVAELDVPEFIPKG
jgi:cell division protein FtsZ